MLCHQQKYPNWLSEWNFIMGTISFTHSLHTVTNKLSAHSTLFIWQQFSKKNPFITDRYNVHSQYYDIENSGFGLKMT